MPGLLLQGRGRFVVRQLRRVGREVLAERRLVVRGRLVVRERLVLGVVGLVGFGDVPGVVGVVVVGMVECLCHDREAPRASAS